MNKEELIKLLKKEYMRGLIKEDYNRGKNWGISIAVGLAEQLDEPEQVVCAENERTTETVEITEEQAWEVIRGNPEIKEFGEILVDHMKYRAFERKIKLLTNLDMDDFIGELTKNGLNKNKLVEVPQLIADYLERCKNYGHNLYGVYHFAPDEVSQWIFDDKYKSERIDLIAQAWLFGYTIEPPKTLQVIVKNYDSTVYKTELPEDEAMKLIEGWKEDE